ncbi:MXAN_5187 C-terminal domain-containing protein [Geomonas ferrireducens]|uniref:MXAN_5187 C-terminal domain-containing protein n=1 Tax=Geomonas ferrireducens TaxID=2570227 RepID=UPI0010A77B56|nr:MXAN_5187 C-terminal domain-containing protein [Geomonas ferrireducens]
MGVAEDIAKLELDLRELIIKYEQYFFGIEKREPLRLLDTVQREVRRYQNVSIPNTSHRFKYESLVSTLSVHKQKWARTNRLIEEGKFQRDRFRMSLHQAERAGKSEKKNTAAPPQDAQIENIYQQYVSARRACNLPVENVTRDKLAEAINRQKPALMEKYRCRDVEFVVVIEGGKPTLKARPKNA